MEYNISMVQADTKVQVADFFSRFHKRIYKKGELILQPDENQGAFYITKGSVREYGISSQGVEISIHIFNPHAYFPMTWVIADVPNRYYYEALNDVHTFNAPKDEVLKFLQTNSAILFDLTKRLLIGVDKLTSRIEYLSYGKAYEKIVSIILYLARHFGEEKGTDICINQKFTHRDIGSLAGITRETTSREWEKLEKKGIITYKNQTIIIHDIERLKKEVLL